MAENSEQVLWASYRKLYINDGFGWGGWLGKGGRRTMFMFLYYKMIMPGNHSPARNEQGEWLAGIIISKIYNRLGEE